MKDKGFEVSNLHLKFDSDPYSVPFGKLYLQALFLQYAFSELWQAPCEMIMQKQWETTKWYENISY